MICPYCKNEETKVLETRETKDIETRRRRECLKCSKRFTTYEKIEQKPLLIIKKNGNRELFDKEKIIKGLLNSCQKRPISLEDIEKIAESVEDKIRNNNEEEIKSSKIGKLIMSRLKKIDKIAYIRFASVYRDFADIEEFKEEIGKLKKK